MFHNFLISYNMSQCNPLGTLGNRPRGKGRGTLLEGRPGCQGPSGQVHPARLGPVSWEPCLVFVGDPPGCGPPVAKQTSLASPLSPFG